ncbi:MAG: hypothetical protein H0T62_04665 [Parachlamydiaceae bacterium]|nr:hypothetical protein [Parachlamydiaceae bacterium]
MNNQGAILGRQFVKNAGVDSALPMLVLYDPIHQTTEQIIQDVNIMHVDLNDQGQTVVLRSSPKIAEGYYGIEKMDLSL